MHTHTHMPHTHNAGTNSLLQHQPATETKDRISIPQRTIYPWNTPWCCHGLLSEEPLSSISALIGCACARFLFCAGLRVTWHGSILALLLIRLLGITIVAVLNWKFLKQGNTQGFCRDAHVRHLDIRTRSNNQQVGVAKSSAGTTRFGSVEEEDLSKIWSWVIIL